MEETHLNLCRRPSGLINICLAFFAIVFANNLVSQTTQLRIQLPKGMNAPLKVSVNEGIFQERGKQYFVENQGSDLLQLELEADSLAQITIAYGDLYREFFVTSRQMQLELSSSTWILKNKDGLNSQIDSINQAVNTSVLNFTRSGGKAIQSKEMIRLSDSLQSISGTCNDSFLAPYYLYAAADLLLISQKFPRKAIQARFFRDQEILPAHPAWKFSFISLFEGEALKQMHNEQFSEAIKTADWLKLRSVFAEDSSIANSNLADCVALLCSYELIFKREYGFATVLPLLENGLKHVRQEHLLAEIKAIIDFHRPRIRGTEFPDIEFQRSADVAKRALSDFKSKPLYVMILPNAGESSQLIMREALTLKKKFGEEVGFLVLLPVQQKDVISEFESGYPGLEFGLTSWSDTGLDKLLRNPDESHFILLNKGLITWQFPAEAPETGIGVTISSLLIGNR